MVSKLPSECLAKIFEEFSSVELEGNQSNAAILNSCILVNRVWCETAMPILWRYPLDMLMMDMIQKKNYDRIAALMSTYLLCLTEEIKDRLIKHGIPVLSENYQTCFDYPIFLKRLNYCWLYDAARYWLKTCDSYNSLIRKERSKCRHQVVYALSELFMDRCNNLRLLGLIDPFQSIFTVKHKSLLRLPLFPGAERSLANLTNFAAMGCTSKKLLDSISQVSHQIEILTIDCCCKDNEGWANLILAQHRLRALRIDAKTNKLPMITEALRKKVDTLSFLRLSPISLSMDIFKQCSELIGISLDDGIFAPEMPLVGFEKFSTGYFPQLFTIDIDSKHLITKDLTTLIKNTKGALQSLSLGWSLMSDPQHLLMYTDTLIESCPNLTRYDGPFSKERISQLPLLFRNCPLLMELVISEFMGDGKSIVTWTEEELRNLGEVVPVKFGLFNLPWQMKCTPEALEQFLIGCTSRLSKPLDLRINTDDTIEMKDVLEKFKEQGVLATL